MQNVPVHQPDKSSIGLVPILAEGLHPEIRILRTNLPVLVHLRQRLPLARLEASNHVGLRGELRESSSLALRMDWLLGECPGWVRRKPAAKSHHRDRAGSVGLRAGKDEGYGVRG